jgi:hypothetical protein
MVNYDTRRTRKGQLINYKPSVNGLFDLRGLDKEDYWIQKAELFNDIRAAILVLDRKMRSIEPEKRIERFKPRAHTLSIQDEAEGAVVHEERVSKRLDRATVGDLLMSQRVREAKTKFAVVTHTRGALIAQRPVIILNRGPAWTNANVSEALRAQAQMNGTHGEWTNQDDPPKRQNGRQANGAGQRRRANMNGNARQNAQEPQQVIPPVLQNMANANVGVAAALEIVAAAQPPQAQPQLAPAPIDPIIRPVDAAPMMLRPTHNSPICVDWRDHEAVARELAPREGDKPNCEDKFAQQFNITDNTQRNVQPFAFTCVDPKPDMHDHVECGRVIPCTLFAEALTRNPDIPLIDAEHPGQFNTRLWDYLREKVEKAPTAEHQLMTQGEYRWARGNIVANKIRNLDMRKRLARVLRPLVKNKLAQPVPSNDGRFFPYDEKIDGKCLFMHCFVEYLDAYTELPMHDVRGKDGREAGQLLSRADFRKVRIRLVYETDRGDTFFGKMSQLMRGAKCKLYYVDHEFWLDVKAYRVARPDRLHCLSPQDAINVIVANYNRLMNHENPKLGDDRREDMNLAAYASMCHTAMRMGFH